MVCILNNFLQLSVSISFFHRVEQQQSRDPTETPQPHPNTTVIRSTSHSEREYDDDDEYDENDPLPDLEKDDMMARRTGSFQKQSAPVNQFLPVPGSVKCNIRPVSGMKQLHSRQKLIERMASERYALCLVTRSWWFMYSLTGTNKASFYWIRRFKCVCVCANNMTCSADSCMSL